MTAREWTWAGGVAVLSMTASWWLFAPEDDVAMPTRGERRLAAPPPVAPAATPAFADPRAAVSAEPPGPLTLLSARPSWPGLAPASRGHGGWAPIPPPPVKAPVPPPPPATAIQPLAPQAPPFPYEPIGQMADAGQVTVFLGGPTSVAAVKAGDTVDGQWRVLQVKDGQLHAVWLPGQVGIQIPLRMRPAP